MKYVVFCGSGIGVHPEYKAEAIALGKEMAKSYDDNYRFIFNNSAGYYAGKTNINYNNSEVGVVTVCEGSEPFLPGKYIIEITADGAVIGQSTLTLD
jgi:hypothetical protein